MKLPCRIGVWELREIVSESEYSLKLRVAINSHSISEALRRAELAHGPYPCHLRMHSKSYTPQASSTKEPPSALPFFQSQSLILCKYVRRTPFTPSPPTMMPLSLRIRLLTRLLRPLSRSLAYRRIATTSTANPAPMDMPKLIVSHGSKHHDSLASYLEYADRKNLDPTSTVHVGTTYEYIVLEALQRLGFLLKRIGRRSDAGIDLIGYWALQPLRAPMPTVVQCKATNRLCGPVLIRELVGTLQHVPQPGWRIKDIWACSSRRRISLKAR